MNKITIHTKLVDYNIDINGYITYVFLNLEYTDWTNKYIMCVRYPNWDQAPFKLGEKGYLTYDEVEGGVDKYFDRMDSTFKVYNFTNIIFNKFVKEVDNSKKDIII
jgi:hypothetical protein